MCSTGAAAPVCSWQTDVERTCNGQPIVLPDSTIKIVLKLFIHASILSASRFAHAQPGNIRVFNPFQHFWCASRPLRGENREKKGFSCAHIPGTGAQAINFRSFTQRHAENQISAEKLFTIRKRILIKNCIFRSAYAKRAMRYVLWSFSSRIVPAFTLQWIFNAVVVVIVTTREHRFLSFTLFILRTLYTCIYPSLSSYTTYIQRIPHFTQVTEHRSIHAPSRKWFRQVQVFTIKTLAICEDTHTHTQFLLQFLVFHLSLSQAIVLLLLLRMPLSNLSMLLFSEMEKNLIKNWILIVVILRFSYSKLHLKVLLIFSVLFWVNTKPKSWSHCSTNTSECVCVCVSLDPIECAERAAVCYCLS